MTVLLALAVAPFGIMAALYLREYAKQGRLVSLVRICVNNLAGVPSIVYGVFGLGFFAYIVGGTIDQLFFPERLPNPTFGSGGLLWASLTLAMLTVPVVIVSTEEALAAGWGGAFPAAAWTSPTRFCCSTTSAPTTRPTTWPASPCTPTAASRPSPTC
jgi:hypothetical protein